MSSMGNAFVACGVIYCHSIDSYTGTTTINFAYDTKTGKQWNLQHSVHQSVQLQLHGGLQPQRKSVVRVGKQAFGHLSNHFWRTIG